MPKRGSGKVLSLTSAATTVVGTVAWCHPLGANCAVEMTSPLASTLAEVCSDQPSLATDSLRRLASSGPGFEQKGRDQKEWGQNLSSERVFASRLPEFIVLLLTTIRVSEMTVEHVRTNAPLNGYHFY